jgi:histidinol phosphatase-like PHP family hydrolase
MIDLHTHTVFSDGELIPSELVRRADALGIKGIAITDHGDFSNMDHIIPRLVKVAGYLNNLPGIRVLPGIEITHVPPAHIEEAAAFARSLGAKVVIVHGETVVEPVAKGTNLAAIKAGVDILAHPGLISIEEAELAAEKGVFLEITARGGHSLSNGHVALIAKKAGAGIVLNTDAHAPRDLISHDFALTVAKGAGLTPDDFDIMLKNSASFFNF